MIPERDDFAWKVAIDRFGTVPTLVDRQSMRKGRDFEDLGLPDFAPENLDLCAFWQGIIWDCPLRTRSMDLRADFLLPGTLASVSAVTGALSQERVAWPEVIRGLDQAELLQRIDSRLTEVCSKLLEDVPPDGKVLLPLSGGLDGRLMAAHLVHTGFDPKRIEVVTFALNRSSLEWRIASRVVQHLGLGKHRFHPIARSGYCDHVDHFWPRWHGGLSVLHSHLYGFLRQHGSEYSLLISGFLADPVAGYAACVPGASGPSLETTGAYKRFVSADQHFSFSAAVRKEIQDDLQSIHADWEGAKLPVEFDEYFYFTQRQPKTVGPLLSMYRRILPVALPYADEKLVALFLACPYELRREKRVSRLLLRLRNPVLEELIDVSSSLSTHSLKARILRFMTVWSARTAVVIPHLTADRIRPFSPFATEDVYGAMRVEFRATVLVTLRGLRRLGVLNAHQESVLSPKPLRAFEVGRHARLLTFLPWALKQEG